MSVGLKSIVTRPSQELRYSNMKFEASAAASSSEAAYPPAACVWHLNRCMSGNAHCVKPSTHNENGEANGKGETGCYCMEETRGDLFFFQKETMIFISTTCRSLS